MSPAHHVNSDVRVDEAITYMLSKDTGAILIKNEQGKYLGIFTKADLIKLLKKTRPYFHYNFLSNVPSDAWIKQNRTMKPEGKC